MANVYAIHCFRRFHFSPSKSYRHIAFFFCFFHSFGSNYTIQLKRTTMNDITITNALRKSYYIVRWNVLQKFFAICACYGTQCSSNLITFQTYKLKYTLYKRVNEITTKRKWISAFPKFFFSISKNDSPREIWNVKCIYHSNLLFSIWLKKKTSIRNDFKAVKVKFLCDCNGE